VYPALSLPAQPSSISAANQFANSISSFYENRNLYLKKFYGRFMPGRSISWIARASPEMVLYSLFSALTASERIKSKQRYYKLAWDPPV